jgi:hypothetical protein
VRLLPRSQIDGREIYVREDREDFDLKAAEGGHAGAGGGTTKRGRPAAQGDGQVAVGKRVYVNNLSQDTSWQALKDHFRQAGNVVHAAVLAVRHNTPSELPRSFTGAGRCASCAHGAC